VSREPLKPSLKGETVKGLGDFQRLPDPSPPTPRSVAYVSDRTSPKAKTGPNAETCAGCGEPLGRDLRVLVIGETLYHYGWGCVLKRPVVVQA